MQSFSFKKMTLAACMCLGLLIPSVASAGEIEVKHAQGTTKVMQNPKKVVVYDLGILDDVAELGATDIIAAVPEIGYPEFMKSFEDMPKAGSLFSPDYEKLAELKPDLVIIASRSAKNYEQLAKMFPTIDLTPRPSNTVEDGIANMRTLGKIFGKEKEAEKAIAYLEKRIADLKQKTSTRGNGLVLITTGGRINLLGPETRLGVVYNNFGVENAAKGVESSSSGHGQSISYEFILNANPEWLFVVDRDAAIKNGGEAAEKLLDNVLIHKTNAWKKGQVVYLDAAGSYLATGGFNSLHRNMDLINAAYDKSASK